MLWKKSLDTWIVHYPYRKTQRWLVGVFVTAGVAVVVAVAVAVAVHMASSKFQSRSIRHVTVAKSRGEGDGATVRRAIGGSEVPHLLPFILLDEFHVGKPHGFPTHPHRGFETLTYVWDGMMEHKDFRGNEGRLSPGDIQWMTAGRGIVHSEMPYGDKAAAGLQLWINLKATDKMCSPSYQNLQKSDIPSTTDNNGISAIVIAGTAMGTTSPVKMMTPLHFIRYKMVPQRVLNHKIPKQWNAFAYILHGSINIGDDNRDITDHHLVTFTRGEDDEGVTIKTTGKSGADFMLACGDPQDGEMIARHGPFVMSTQEEITAAVSDYRNGKNGFEGADTWDG